MKKRLNFLNEFFKKENKVGSVAPSSRFLVRKMVEPIDFDSARVIIEFGPGTGVITTELLKNMRDDAVLYAFEINEEFAQGLSLIRDRRFRLIRDSAERLEEYLAQDGIRHADYVVSSLPLAIIPREVEYTILRAAARALKRGGSFIQFQYSLASRKKLKEIFHSIKTNFTPINIPPAFVFTCVKG
ncbi:MAG: methyltransferase [Bacteroidota bacterium]